TLSIDARAAGPLARLVPRGSLQVKDGKVAISEWGDYGGIAVEARMTEDAVEVSRLEVHRGSGRLSASGALTPRSRGGSSPKASSITPWRPSTSSASRS
ncbi:MAG TPA: hypothetical protein VIU29_03130, partial [Candidatus Deferrimicrobiaceae bacterium]